MLELHIQNPDVTSGTIRVGWCVPKEDLEKLARYKIKDPVIVLVIAPDGDNYHTSKEVRKVVPLKDFMAYIDFKCSGKNKIWGYISLNSKKKTKEAVLERNGLVLNSDGDNYCYSLRVDDDEGITAEPLSVMVPKEVFAPEPSEWEKTWVNYLFSSNCKDQCNFRKRRIFAYTLQPFIVLFSILFRFFAVLCALMIGSRNFSLNPLIHPLTYGLGDAVGVVGGGTIFIGRSGNKFKDYSKLLFMPVTLCIIALLVKFHLIFGFLTLLLALATLAAIAFGSAIAIIRLKVKHDECEDKEPLWYMEEEEMNLIVCNGQPRPLTINQLPKKHRTFRLRFLDLKSKVCRPFSA